MWINQNKLHLRFELALDFRFLIKRYLFLWVTSLSKICLYPNRLHYFNLLTLLFSLLSLFYLNFWSMNHGVRVEYEFSYFYFLGYWKSDTTILLFSIPLGCLLNYTCYLTLKFSEGILNNFCIWSIYNSWFID